MYTSLFYLHPGSGIMLDIASISGLVGFIGNGDLWGLIFTHKSLFGFMGIYGYSPAARGQKVEVEYVQTFIAVSRLLPRALFWPLSAGLIAGGYYKSPFIPIRIYG